MRRGGGEGKGGRERKKGLRKSGFLCLIAGESDNDEVSPGVIVAVKSFHHYNDFILWHIALGHLLSNSFSCQSIPVGFGLSPLRLELD